MKKVTLFKLSAIALAMGVASFANAGTLSGTAASIFATENFGPTATAAIEIKPGPVTHGVSTTGGIAVNAGGSVYYYFRLAGGTFTAAPIAGEFTGTLLAVGGPGNGVVGAPVLSTDKTTLMVPVTFTAGATIGIGATLIWTPVATKAVSAVNTTLAVAGGVVTATASMSAAAPTVIAPSLTTAPNTGTAQAADLDGAAVTATIASSSKAVAVAVDSAMTGYANKIDLTAVPAGSNYVTAGNIALGSVTYTDSAAVERNSANTANYDLTAVKSAASTTITVTPVTGTFPIGATLWVDSTANTCAVPVAGTTTAAVIASTAATVKTFTVPAANVLTGAPVFVCMSAPSATNTAAPMTTTITGTITNTAIVATDAADTATAAGYAVTYNGQSKTLTTYVPAAVAGYTALVRVTNTGSVAAPISLSVTSEAGVTTAAATPVVATLAAGATTNLTAALIETNLATPANFTAGARPRITVSAPTNGLSVQSFVVTPNGALTELSGLAQ